MWAALKGARETKTRLTVKFQLTFVEGSSRFCALLSFPREQRERPPQPTKRLRSALDSRNPVPCVARVSCARVSCAVSDWLAVLPRRMCPLSLLRPEAQRRARAPKWHACCERTVRAGISAAVCQRDTDTRRRATNPAVRREPPTSGPTALALSMSPVCAVASGRGGV